MRSETEGDAKREVGRRRRFSKEFKRQVVQETLAGGASVAGIALRYRLNANPVFTWRRRYLPALTTTESQPVEILPVTIADAGAAVPVVAPKLISTSKSARRSRPRGAIEIELNGARIHKGRPNRLALQNP